MRKLAALLLLLAPTLCAEDFITKGGVGSGTITRSLGEGTITKAHIFEPSSDPVCEGEFFADTFTEIGTGNLALGSHAPDTGGGSWLRTEADDEIVVDRSTDEAKSTNGSGNTKLGYWSLTPDCTNYSVTASAKLSGAVSSNRVGVLGRWLDTSGGNGYEFRVDGDGTARLRKWTNGTSIDLDTDAVASFSASTYYAIELRMNGTTIQGYVNDVLECTVTDSAHASGTLGIVLRNTNVRMTSVVGEYL